MNFKQLVSTNPSVAGMHKPAQMKADREAITDVLTNVVSAERLGNENAQHKGNAGSHRIQSQFNVTSSDGSSQAISVVWNFKAFNNKDGKVQVSINHPRVGTGASIQMPITQLPEAIKTLMSVEAGAEIKKTKPLNSTESSAVRTELTRMQKALAVPATSA